MSGRESLLRPALLRAPTPGADRSTSLPLVADGGGGEGVCVLALEKAQSVGQVKHKKQAYSHNIMPG